jgi:hypothetical protein
MTAKPNDLYHLLPVSVSPFLFLSLGGDLLLRFPGGTVFAMPGHNPAKEGFWMFPRMIT